MTDTPVLWDIEVPLDQKEAFIKLVQDFVAKIDPGDSLKEVHIIADNALASEIQSLTGRSYQQGPYSSPGVAVPCERGGTFSSTILIRQAFFVQGETRLDEHVLGQLSILVEELYHCRLYHQTWQRRRFINSHSADPYARDLFNICQQMHDEYAVARLKNMFFGENVRVPDAQGQQIPFFIEYGYSLTALLDQASRQLHAGSISQKDAMPPFAYRYIFEPLARHAGFLTPIPPGYPLRWPDNNPEDSTFYREDIAPYWIPMKEALESSFASQFTETEKALRTITEMMNTCFDRLLEISINNKG